MFFIGCIVSVALLITGHKPIKCGGGWRFEIGKTYWGGLSLGLCFLTYKDCIYPTYVHEYGHSLQNAIWGILFPFVIGIPSAIRYWVFTYRERHNIPNPDYLDIWFESQATAWGDHTYDKWNK